MRRKKQDQTKKKGFRFKTERPYREKRCFFCVHADAVANYKDVERLRDYVTKSGKVLPRRITGVCAKHQRALTREIMRARVMALLPYIRKY